MPNFSPFCRANSRHSSRTTHPRHTSFASRVEAPRSGKKRSGSTPRQLASSCQPWSPGSDVDSNESYMVEDPLPCGPVPPVANRGQRRNYIAVIVAYHITYAQGRIARFDNLA